MSLLRPGLIKDEEKLAAKRRNAERVKEFSKNVTEFNRKYMPAILNLPSQSKVVRNFVYMRTTQASPVRAHDPTKRQEVGADYDLKVINI
jgi:3-methyladenine DNA glycosylase Tag